MVIMISLLAGTSNWVCGSIMSPVLHTSRGLERRFGSWRCSRWSAFWLDVFSLMSEVWWPRVKLRTKTDAVGMAGRHPVFRSGRHFIRIRRRFGSTLFNRVLSASTTPLTTLQKRGARFYDNAGGTRGATEQHKSNGPVLRHFPPVIRRGKTTPIQWIGVRYGP